MAEEVFTFEDENGKKIDFTHVASFDIDNVWYAGFAPVESTDDISDDEVVFFRVEGDDEEQELVAVVDEKELDKVWTEFQKLANEENCHCDEGDDCGCHGHKKSKNCKCDKK